jgi:hypothetical protein
MKEPNDVKKSLKQLIKFDYKNTLRRKKLT